MYVNQTKAEFDAAAVAAGMVLNTDLATKQLGSVGGATLQMRVMPLTMKGLRYLMWTLDLDVPILDVLVLLTNIQAEASANSTAWPQT